jgi:hypothetical protein
MVSCSLRNAGDYDAARSLMYSWSIAPSLPSIQKELLLFLKSFFLHRMLIQDTLKNSTLVHTWREVQMKKLWKR